MISTYLPHHPITIPNLSYCNHTLSHTNTPYQSSHILSPQEDLPSNVDPLYVDALLAIHSDLFILNPKSTFSWMIYVVRVALALQVTHPTSNLCYFYVLCFIFSWMIYVVRVQVTYLPLSYLPSFPLSLFLCNPLTITHHVSCLDLYLSPTRFPLPVTITPNPIPGPSLLPPRCLPPNPYPLTLTPSLVLSLASPVCSLSRVCLGVVI